MKPFVKTVAPALIMLMMPALAQAGVTIEGAWVRLPPPVADNAAAYLTLNNTGDQDIAITQSVCDAADKSEFHSMTLKDGMMHMQPMLDVVVPAQGRLHFTPEGNHLMLIGLKRALHAGEHIAIRLNTGDGGNIDVDAEVRDMRGSHNHHGMH